ncbi:MAG: hypothetical protein ACO1OF_23125 [Adhaeribacter sp.]
MKNLLRVLFLFQILNSCNEVTGDQKGKEHLKNETITSDKSDKGNISRVDTIQHVATKKDLTRPASVEKGQNELGDLRKGALNNQYFTVSEPCAIIYSPNSKRIRKLKKEMSEDDYATVIDDNMYYLAETRTLLEEKGVKIFNTEATLLEFKKSDGSSLKMDLAKESQLFGVIAFNGKDKPIKLDMTLPEPELSEYMNK